MCSMLPRPQHPLLLSVDSFGNVGRCICLSILFFQELFGGRDDIIPCLCSQAQTVSDIKQLLVACLQDGVPPGSPSSDSEAHLFAFESSVRASSFY